MQAEENSKAEPKGKTKKRIFKLILALIVVLIVLVPLLIPAFVSSDKARRIILAKINDSVTDGQVDFAALSMGWFKGIELTDFSFNDAAGQTLAKVKQIVTKPNYYSILSGSLSLRETAIKNVQVNEQLSEKILKYLNPIFAGAVNVSGVANLSCEQLTIPLGEADPNDIEVIGTVSIDQLRLQTSGLLGQLLSVLDSGSRGQVITIHPTKFTLQDGFLRYDDMQMDIGDNPINFKGVIGMDNSLNMTVTLPYTTRGTTAKTGKETSGERITLSLKGTVDKPELDVGKLLKEQLEKQLEDQLKEKVLEGIDKLLKNL